MKITDSPIAGRLWAIAATLLMSYAGYDQYEKRTGEAVTTVNVNLESVPDEVVQHSHGRVLSGTDIKLMIREEISAYDAQVKETYKPLEAWEK